MKEEDKKYLIRFKQKTYEPASIGMVIFTEDGSQKSAIETVVLSLNDKTENIDALIQLNPATLYQIYVHLRVVYETFGLTEKPESWKRHIKMSEVNVA